MKWHQLALLGLAAIAMPAPSLQAASTDPSLIQDLPTFTIQCVPYARETSGILIFGDAYTWWDQAEGRYARGTRPRVGAVLAFSASDAMPGGHVATVSRVLGSRDILLDHANWSGPNLVEHDVLARDVSPDNDWSDVRVWYGPANALGTRVNPAHGFIYPGNAAPAAVRYASATSVAKPAQSPASKPVSKPANSKVKKDRDPFIVEYADADPVNLIPAAFFKRH